MADIYIVGACRTAIGSFGGSLKDVPAVALGEVVIREAIARAGIKPGEVDEVIMGNVLQAGLGQNPARQAAVNAGIPFEVPSMTVNKVCGSGLKSVNLAAQAIKAVDANCVISGGMENMSRVPYLLHSLRWGARMGNGQIVDGMIIDGLWDIFNDYHMGMTAENVAERYGISKQEQDEYAYESQVKAGKAVQTGVFKDEIVPVDIPQRKGDPVSFDTDEFVRLDTTYEKISRLKAAFKKDGTVTAGNSSGINDGAAALLIASEAFVKEHRLKPMAKIVSYGSKGVNPELMGIGPVPSIQDALKKVGLTVDDMGVVEANEAFAAQSIAVARELKLKPERVNRNGGAIALGHPIGASGARILVSLLYELKRTGERYGLAALCIGGGMGEALIVENADSIII